MDILTYSFMQNALAACVLASLACGIVGTLVVTNRLTFLAGGIAHAAYGGIGIALFFGLPVLACTLGFSVFSSLVMGTVVLRQEKNQARSKSAPSDSAIGVLWAAGMAFGIILVELTPGYAGDLMGFLFGSILAVPAGDLIIMAVFDVLLLAVLWFFHQGLWAISLDKEYARSRGLPVNALFLLLVLLTAVTVVMLIRVVGLILVLALLSIPPALARRFCNSFYPCMFIACALSLLFCLAGFFISWHTDLSCGPCIIAVATLSYFAGAYIPKASKPRAA